MVGRPLTAIFPERDPHAGEIGARGRKALRRQGASPMSASPCAPGRSSACSAWSGSGRTEVAKAIFGATPVVTGEIDPQGRAGRSARPREAAIRAGMAMLTEDRKGDGLALDVQRARQCQPRRLSAHVAPRGASNGESAAPWSASKIDELTVRPRAHASGWCGNCPAATSRRWSSPSGSWSRAPSFSSSTSRRAASTSPPRSRSTR